MYQKTDLYALYSCLASIEIKSEQTMYLPLWKYRWMCKGDVIMELKSVLSKLAAFGVFRLKIPSQASFFFQTGPTFALALHNSLHLVLCSVGWELKTVRIFPFSSSTSLTHYATSQVDKWITSWKSMQIILSHLTSKNLPRR